MKTPMTSHSVAVLIEAAKAGNILYRVDMDGQTDILYGMDRQEVVNDILFARDLQVIPDGWSIRPIHAADLSDYEWVMSPSDVRKTLGLSQQAMADMIGVNIRTLQTWESGQKTPAATATKLLSLLAWLHQTGQINQAITASPQIDVGA